MNCDDLLRTINEYIDGEVDPSMCKTFEKHLADCDPCQVFVDTLSKTVKLYKGDEVFEIPIEFKKKLDQTLRERWNQRNQ